VALAQMIFNAIVATQYHRGYQAQHFFGFYVQSAIGIGGGIKRKKTFDIGIGTLHNPVVHSVTVVVKFVY
jgi:hypothetical protein